MNIHSSFPRYQRFNPLVPVWCITHDADGCIHRFFDTSPISPSGRYVAVFQLPFENRRPEPGEVGFVRVVDLESGNSRIVAESRGWEPQLGANINWGASDHQLIFNDVDVQTWRPFSWMLDPISGEKRKLNGTVYHASRNGKWIVSANLPLLPKTQYGYGVMVPQRSVRQNVGLVEDDGFYLTDCCTGECRLLVSIRELITEANPPISYDGIENCEIYGAHAKFNHQSTRVMLSLRWFRAGSADIWNVAEHDYKALRFAWMTASVDGGAIHCAAGPELFERGGHHASWMPDGEHISMNLRLNGRDMRFVSVRYDGVDLKEMVRCIRGSGHPSVHPDGYIVTDTYLKSWDYSQYGDGTVPLRWIDIPAECETVAVRINTKQPCEDIALRVDPHPAWDRSWRYVAFNGFVGGTRRVFLADMKPLLSGRADIVARRLGGMARRQIQRTRRIIGMIRRRFKA